MAVTKGGESGPRRAILAKIRSGLARSSPLPAPPRRPPQSVPAAPVAGDTPQELADRFQSELTAIGGLVRQCRNLPEAAAFLLDLFQKEQITRVGRSTEPLCDALPYQAGLHALGIREVLDADASGSDPWRRLESIEVGITEAAWGIANTGTLVLYSGPTLGRLCSLMPKTHVALLQKSHLLADLDAFFAAGLAPVTSGRVSAITLITGSSRTADIELIPVMGVHGPRRVVAILLDEDFSEGSPPLRPG